MSSLYKYLFEYQLKLKKKKKKVDDDRQLKKYDRRKIELIERLTKVFLFICHHQYFKLN